MSITVRRPFHHFSPARGRQWRRRFILFLLLLASVLIQGAWGSAGFLFGFRPDLVLIIVVYWALNEGPAAGWLVGMTGGLMADLFSAGLFGLHSLALAATGLLVALSSNPLYRVHLTTRVVMVAVASLVCGLSYYLLLFVFAEPVDWAPAWRYVLWPSIWQTTLVSPLWLRLTDLALSRFMNKSG